MGVLFSVQNKLGNKYQEKHYQRAIAITLKNLGIQFEKEVKIDVPFEKESLGIFFADFVIDGKIILEIKTIPKITINEIKRTLRYLQTTNLHLGIIANFRPPHLEFKRVVN